MAESLRNRIRHYVLDGSDRDLRRLLSIAEVQAESARRAILRIGNFSGKRAVECGCGPLGSLAVLSEVVGREGTVLGIDFDAATVERARSVLATLGIDNVQVVAGDVNDINSAALGDFDLAYTRAFLMHQMDPTATLLRVAELLRPGGWLVAQEPLSTPPPTSYPKVDALGRYWALMYQASAKSGVRPDGVENLIAAASHAGFEVVAMGGFFNVVPPKVGFKIHASAVAALGARLIGAGVATEAEVDELEASLRAAASSDSGWVATPFMFDLTLRKL